MRPDQADEAAQHGEGVVVAAAAGQADASWQRDGRCRRGSWSEERDRTPAISVPDSQVDRNTLPPEAAGLRDGVTLHVWAH